MSDKYRERAKRIFKTREGIMYDTFIDTVSGQLKKIDRLEQEVERLKRGLASNFEKGRRVEIEARKQELDIDKVRIELIANMDLFAEWARRTYKNTNDLKHEDTSDIIEEMATRICNKFKPREVRVLSVEEIEKLSQDVYGIKIGALRPMLRTAFREFYGQTTKQNKYFDVNPDKIYDKWEKDLVKMYATAINSAQEKLNKGE